MVRATRLRRLRVHRAVQATTAAAAFMMVAGVFVFALQKTSVVGGRTQAVLATSSNVQDLVGLHVASPEAAQTSGVGVWAMVGTGPGSAVPVGLPVESVSANSAGTSSVVSVRAVVLGKVYDVSTNAGTAGELLSAMGIRSDADDRVRPSPSTPLHDGATLTFDLVEVVTKVQAVRIPPRTHVEYTSQMVPGSSRVLSEGRPGVGRATYRIEVVNGQVVSKVLIGRWIERAPVDKRVLSGPESMYGGTTDVPGAVGATQTGQATWYDPPWSGLTAAHPALPFGTPVTVTDLASGRSVILVINDRGPFAPGRIIDLSPEAFQVLAPLGRGVLDVHIAW